MTKAIRYTAVLLAGIFAGGAASAAQSCNAEVGSDAAQDYVAICLEVSPATHPPCNAENPCQMIWDEITRGCSMLGSGAPRECDDYLG